MLWIGNTDNLNFVKDMGVCGRDVRARRDEWRTCQYPRPVKEVVATSITRGERSSKGTAQAISAAVRERSCANIVPTPRGLERASGAITDGIYCVKVRGYVPGNMGAEFFWEMHDG